MNDDFSSPGSDARVDREAADWLVKHDRGLTAAEQDEFLQWLAADPRHQEWFARHRRTWTEFNLLAQWRPEHSAEPNPDLLARPRPRRRQVQRWAVALAAAAAVAVTWTLWPSRGDSREGAAVEIATSGYEQRVLEDGSVVDLNGGARLLVQYTESERAIALLRGEAQFTVAKNPARPFVVRTSGVSVRALGTAFNVRLDADEVEILVTHGKVQLEHSAPPAHEPAVASGPARAEPAPTTETAVAVAAPAPVPPPQLVAGQRTVVSLAAGAPAPRVVAATPEDLNRLRAWKPQLLDFESTPLTLVVAEFNRRNRTQLVIGDESLRQLPVVASFRSDNVDGFVRLLELTAEVRGERTASGDIVLRKAR